MAAKRFFDGAGDDQPNQKRPKTRFASVIREVVMVNFFENFCSALEPMLRRVVSEEVENELRRQCANSAVFQCPPSRMIRHAPAADHCRPPTSLQLVFPKPPALPIFTGSKIVDADGSPLQIILIDTHTKLPTALPRSVKLEIVVLDGDFPSDSAATWTPDEFARSIIKERTGKRPLLAGDLTVTIRDGIASLGEIEFTDNSSWIRSRKFRIGARVATATAGREAIHEAITEAFVVKDHRGELYKKHHPPELEDAVWRLEKIGKGGAFHQKLAVEGIHTVQDFLKLFHVDPAKLKSTLGGGMSEKMWEATVKHAKECVIGNKLYKLHANNCTLTFNSVCQMLRFESNGQIYQLAQPKAMHVPYIEALVKDAYAKWNTLEVVDGPVHQSTPLLTQGEVMEQLQYPIDEEEYVTETGDECMGNSALGFFYLPTNTATQTTSNSKNGVRFFSPDQCPSSSDHADDDHIP